MTAGVLTFGRDAFGYGLAAAMAGMPHVRVTPRTARLVDWLFLSCFWWEHIYLLADFMRRAGLALRSATRPRICIGGFAPSFNPVPYRCYGDVVVVGDGEDVPGKLVAGEPIESAYTGAETVVPYRSVPLRVVEYQANNISRIEVARGCRYRCRFCAVAHHKPYRELPIDEIERAVAAAKQPRVALFAPEPTLHSGYDQFADICARHGKSRSDTDVRLDRVDFRNCSMTPRFGLEGISERLRRSVRKPYSNDFVVEVISRAIGNVGAIFIYLILDLPGETDEDWAEFAALLERIDQLPGVSALTLKPSPNTFLPTPGTPMADDGIHWDVDYREKWERFFMRGRRRPYQHVKLVPQWSAFSPGMRVLSMVATRAGSEFGELERELTCRGAIRVASGRVQAVSLPVILRVLDNYGGVEHYCGKRTGGPWEVVGYAN